MSLSLLLAVMLIAQVSFITALGSILAIVVSSNTSKTQTKKEEEKKERKHCYHDNISNEMAKQT